MFVRTPTGAAVSIFTLTLVCTTALAGFDLTVSDGQGKHRDLDSVVAEISSSRAVFIGENHDRYDQHLSELEIIRRLYQQDPNRRAIGVEFIQTTSFFGVVFPVEDWN